MSCTVSVVVPVFNAAAFVEPTLESVFRQTFRDIEVIVVDDGSTDNTRAVLEKYSDRIRYLYKENGGQSSSRNAGIKVARGRYIALLDHDDIWDANKLELQLREIERDAATGMVTCGSERFNEAGTLGSEIPRIRQFTGNQFRRKLLMGNFLGSCSKTLIKKECFDTVGFFDESLRMAEDWDMWFRIAQSYAIRAVERRLVRYRIHARNYSSSSGEINLANELVFLGKAFAVPEFRRARWLKRQAYGRRYFIAAAAVFQEGGTQRSRELLAKALSYYPPLVLRKRALGLLRGFWLARGGGPQIADRRLQTADRRVEVGVAAPLVSVIVPAYNGAAYIGDALDSVLAQRYRPIEIVVVDDGSTDETPSVLAGYAGRITTIRQPHSGNVARPRNVAIRRARGALLAFLDADDLWLPYKLETQMALMRDRMCMLGTSGRVQGQRTGAFRVVGYRELLLRNRFAASSVIMHRHCLDTVGMFDENPKLFGVEDWDLWLRIAARFPAFYVDQELVHVRQVPGSVSSAENFAHMLRSESALLAKHRINGFQKRCSPLLWARSRAGSHVRAAIGAQQIGLRREAAIHLLWAFRAYPPSWLSGQVRALFRSSFERSGRPALPDSEKH